LGFAFVENILCKALIIEVTKDGSSSLDGSSKGARLTAWMVRFDRLKTNSTALELFEST
jgi:hypothetical protein